MVIATEKEALTKPLSFVLKKARSSKNAADHDAKENIKNKGQKIFLLLTHIKVQISWEDHRRVLLVFHKNKWHDLSQKLVTSLFLFIEGGQENIFIGPKNIFDQ